MCVRERGREKEREGFWRYYIADFEDGGRGFEPRDVGCLQKLEKTRNGVSLRTSRRIATLLTS